MAAIEYDAELEHLVRMASDPNWKLYAWKKAQGLETKCPELWRGICDDLKDRMTSNTTDEPRPGVGSI